MNVVAQQDTFLIRSELRKPLVDYYIADIAGNDPAKVQTVRSCLHIYSESRSPIAMVIKVVRQVFELIRSIICRGSKWTTTQRLIMKSIRRDSPQDEQSDDDVRLQARAKLRYMIKLYDGRITHISYNRARETTLKIDTHVYSILPIIAHSLYREVVKELLTLDPKKSSFKADIETAFKEKAKGGKQPSSDEINLLVSHLPKYIELRQLEKEPPTSS